MNDSLAACFTLGNLLDAAEECRKEVDWKAQVQRFMLHALTECVKLRDQVLSGKWKPTKGKPFIVHERGKTRRVVPPTIWTRVVERCFADQVLTDFILKNSIPDSGACLKGRGLTYTMERLRTHYENAPLSAWVVQYDIHDYFGSINRTLLLAMLELFLATPYIEFVALCIGGEGVGLDLGSHISQLLACWFPTIPLDHSILRSEGVLSYHRYMDDGIAIVETQAQAMHLKESIENWAGSIGLQMNPKKTHVNRITHPHVFCKHRYVKRASGVRVLTCKKQSKRTIRHVRNVVKVAEEKGIDLLPVRASCGGYLDFADNKLSHLLDERIDWPE